MSDTALFISPHLDDVAFSCGGTLVKLLRANWRVCLCTVFTASVPNPGEFALACQLDKNLAPEVDYMKLRRDEDREFARAAGLGELIHLPHREAPHRNYNSPAELFAGVHQRDVVWRDVAPELRSLAGRTSASIVFAPQGLGNHADHLQVIRAVLAAGLAPNTLWYRDTPYAIREPHAAPSPLLSKGLRRVAVRIDETLETKSDACGAYTTQVPFQFGSNHRMRSAFEVFHRAEARGEFGDGYAETFLTTNELGLAWQSRFGSITGESAHLKTLTP